MNKHSYTILAAALQFAATAAVPVTWTNSPGMPPYPIKPVPHGSTVDLAVTLRGYTTPPIAPGADVRLWYQTNGMGQAWWSAPATFDGNTIAASFGPAQDTGADRVSLFFGAPSNVFASAVLRLTHSPGFAPASLPLPTPVLDFGAVELRNLHALTNGWHFGGGAEMPVEVSSITNAVKNYAAGEGPPSPALTYGWYFDGTAARATRAEELGAVGQAYMPLFRYDANASRWVSEWQWGTSEVAYLSDIPAPPDLSGYATVDALGAVDDTARAAQGTANGLSGRVAALETWAVGDETALSVTDAGTSNATLRISYTNRVMYSSAAERTNAVNEANAYTDRKTADVVSAVDAALATKADRAWGTTTSGGAPSPEGTLYVEKRKVTITGGGNYAYLASSTGGYWVLSVSLGSEWTIQALADAQNPTNPATASFIDADGNAAWTVTSTGTRVAYALQGQQYIYVEDVGGNDVVTITYPITSDDHPTCLYDPECIAGKDMKEASAANFPDYIALVEWSGHSGEWVCRVTMNGKPGRGFFSAKYVKPGTVYTRYDKPLGLSTVVIGKTEYRVRVETVNGKKLMVLEDL